MSTRRKTPVSREAGAGARPGDKVDGLPDFELQRAARARLGLARWPPVMTMSRSTCRGPSCTATVTSTAPGSRPVSLKLDPDVVEPVSLVALPPGVGEPPRHGRERGFGRLRGRGPTGRRSWPGPALLEREWPRSECRPLVDADRQGRRGPVELDCADADRRSQVSFVPVERKDLPAEQRRIDRDGVGWTRVAEAPAAGADFPVAAEHHLTAGAAEAGPDSDDDPLPILPALGTTSAVT